MKKQEYFKLCHLTLNILIHQTLTLWKILFSEGAPLYDVMNDNRVFNTHSDAQKGGFTHGLNEHLRQLFVTDCVVAVLTVLVIVCHSLQHSH